MSRCKSSFLGIKNFITVMAVGCVPEEFVKESLGQYEGFLGKRCNLNSHLCVTVE